MKEGFDVVVVGGGPSGLFASALIADKGFDVVLFESKGEIGEGVVCAGILGIEAFRRFGLPTGSILGEIDEVRFISPRGSVLSYHHPEPLAYILDRPGFDMDLARDAEGKGVFLKKGSTVKRIDHRKGDLAVFVEGPQGIEEWRAKICILATGPKYTLHRDLGLGVPKEFLRGAQVSMPFGMEGLGYVEVFVGKDVAPDAFGWRIPCPGGLSRVGIMTSRDPVPYLKALVSRISGGDMGSRISMRPVAQGLSGRTFSDRVLAVGEAASQVKTTTGGGIYYGLIGAEAAAQTVSEAFRAWRFDRSFLSRYEGRWKEEIWREIRIGGRMRKAFASLDDRRMEALFGIMGTEEMISIVRNKVRFDWHMDLLRAVLKKTSIRKLLGLIVGV